MLTLAKTLGERTWIKEDIMVVHEKMICVERFTRAVSVGRVRVIDVNPVSYFGPKLPCVYTRQQDKVYILPAVHMRGIHDVVGWSSWID